MREARVALCVLLIVTFTFVAYFADNIFAVEQPKADTPPRYVIPERVVQGSEICAEYTSASAPRTPNRACVDAATVKMWLLANGRPTDECSE